MVSVETVFTAQYVFYPRFIELIVLGTGFAVAVWTTYRFSKMIYFSSKNLFGILTRHLRALFRVALFVGLGELFYFVTRITAVLFTAFDTYLILFDLAALVLMVATVIFALPLLKTLQTIPHVYGEQ